MSNAEADKISKYLRTKDIHLSSNNEWLLDCIHWYNSHLGLRKIYNSLEDYVCIQWLLSDLRDVKHQCLPTNCKNGIVQLTGKYSVQVNWVRDISQPCYTQLQAMKNNNIADSNEHVSAEETKKQNWEPSPKRVLMLEITDGFTTLKAMEYSPIHQLIEPFIPGFKVVLNGCIECRNGILFLKSNNISLLGGEVDYMGVMYSKENILSNYLNITPSHSDNSERDTIGPSTTSSLLTPTNSNSRPQLLSNDVDQLPDSTSFIESNTFEDNRGAVMVDDDDDMLCQLPDTMFNDVDNFDPHPNQLSPVLGEDPHEEVESSNIPEEAPVIASRATNVNRPKLFPSMEDLRPGTESSYNTKQSTLTTTLRRETTPTEPKASSSSRHSTMNLNAFFKSSAFVTKNISHEKHTETIESAPSLNNSVVEHRKLEPELLKNHIDENLNDSIANHIDHMLGETGDDNVYPQFKRINVKVLSITKLKIRNSEWTCSALVHMEDKSENVTFSNKVLEKLFGTSASEVETLRSEMAKNQSLKEKINYILKAGQTKLKLLNCLMIVEYSYENCIPIIVSVHEERV